jgi:hypothetical protein
LIAVPKGKWRLKLAQEIKRLCCASFRLSLESKVPI